MVYNFSCCSQAISWWNSIRISPVSGWMEIPDVTVVSKAVQLKSLFDGLAWHLVCVRGPPSSSYHTCIQGNMGWWHAVLLWTFPKLVQNKINFTVPLSPSCWCYLSEIRRGYMKEPFNLLKSCLAHILANRVGRIQPIMPPVVPHCRGTMYPHIPHNPQPNPLFWRGDLLPLPTTLQLSFTGFSSSICLGWIAISSNSNGVQNRLKISKGSTVCW